MTNTLNVRPETDEVKTGVRDIEGIAEGLGDVLADTYRLTFKTHAYHWNVTGPLFYAIHKLTEGQYENMFAAADALAERIRALGHIAPMQMADIVGRSRIEDRDDMPTPREMIEDLANDHGMLARRLHALVELAGDRNDPATEDLATARSAFHEQAAWMLRATIAE